MRFSFRHSLKSKCKAIHINEEKKQRWYNTPEFRWHAPFVGVTVVLFAFGATHDAGFIGAGVLLLVCTLISLALMRYARRSMNALVKKAAECRPNARFYSPMIVHRDSIPVLLPHSSAKSLNGVLVALDWGLELWNYKMEAVLTSLKWQEILGAEATSSMEGSEAVDVLVLWLTEGRVVQFYTYAFAQIPDAFILSRPDSDPWIPPDDEAPIRWS
ncbi:MAG: hypothetical protein N2645_00790 [Clostridia bacterium]|nr:hypothetical protein [Clostridia bacterium]